MSQSERGATSRRLTRKKRVLRRHPSALCYWSSLYGEWQVRLKNRTLIGIGGSPAAAWKDADVR